MMGMIFTSNGEKPCRDSRREGRGSGKRGEGGQALVVCCVTLLTAGQQQSSERKAPLTYQLYSWEDASRAWNFCVLPDSNRQKTVTEVFNPNGTLKGLHQLERKLSEIPKGSRVIWFDRLTLGGVKVKGSEKLKYPPGDIVAAVRRSAEARNIEVIGP
jgi:hypothetical protein